ncbi:MAG: hypothetical protein IIB19_04255, partial [Chloroflexi bacterium]|nr:hypothetical protein [Chloroflexota bacterium]
DDYDEALGNPGSVYQFMGADDLGLDMDLATQNYTDLDFWKEILETQLIPQGLNVTGSDSKAVGGLVVDLDEGPLAAAQPSGGGAGRLAGTIAGIAALAVALTGAAWYAKRRWVT